MSTTTREQVNALGSMHDWLRDHQDQLPDGWRIDVLTRSLDWHSVDSDTGAALAALVTLLGEPPITDSTGRLTWAEWPREGDRPRLTVYLRGGAR